MGSGPVFAAFLRHPSKPVHDAQPVGPALGLRRRCSFPSAEVQSIERRLQAFRLGRRCRWARRVSRWASTSGARALLPLNRDEIIYRSRTWVRRWFIAFRRPSLPTRTAEQWSRSCLFWSEPERSRRWGIMGTMALLAAALEVFACAARAPVIALTALAWQWRCWDERAIGPACSSRGRRNLLLIVPLSKTSTIRDLSTRNT